MMNHLTTQRLTTAVKNLSLSKNEQEEYLRRLGTYPSLDELALEFDDVYQLYIDGDVRQENPVLMWSLKELNDKLDSMSKTTNLTIWHADALDNSDWSSIRSLSQHALYHLKIFEILGAASGFSR
jgi:hypothetical protein